MSVGATNERSNLQLEARSHDRAAVTKASNATSTARINERPGMRARVTHTHTHTHSRARVHKSNDYQSIAYEGKYITHEPA